MVYLFFLGVVVTLIITVLEHFAKSSKMKHQCVRLLQYIKLPMLIILFVIVVGNSVNVNRNSTGYNKYKTSNDMRDYEIEDAYSYLRITASEVEQYAEDISTQDMYKVILTARDTPSDNYLSYKIEKVQTLEGIMKDSESSYYNYILVNKLIWGK